MMKEEVERAGRSKGRQTLRLIVFESYAYFCQITLRPSQPKLI